MSAQRTPSSSTPVHFRVEPADLHAHLFAVTLTVAAPAAKQELSLPVWIPGSYLVREFSKNLQSLQATQGGRPIALKQIDKHRWQAQCKKGQPLLVTYEVAAYDTSVRTAWLDASRGFFNGTSLCLRVHGQEDALHALEIVRTPAVSGWSVATGLASAKVTRAGFGTYVAANYDELVDWVPSGAPDSRRGACHTGWWLLVLRLRSMVTGWWPTCGASASTRFAFGMAPASHRMPATFSS